MKNKIFTLLFVFSCICSFSQTKEDALRDAKKAAKATLESDFNTVLDHTFPVIVDVMGGKENAIKLIKSAFDTMKKDGFVLEKAEVISVSDIVKEDGKYRCYVKGINQMKVNDNRIINTSYLFGEYDEKNKKWFFLEAEKMKNSALMERLFPGFKTSLKIPNDETKMEKIK